MIKPTHTMIRFKRALRLARGLTYRTDSENKVKTVDELGKQFVALRSQGVSNLIAYNAVKAVLDVSRKPVPPRDRGGKRFFGAGQGLLHAG